MTDFKSSPGAACGLLCLAVCLLAACGGQSDDAPALPDGGDTPQAVVDGLRDAAEKDDIARFNAYVLPDQRALLTFGLAVFPVKRLVELSEAMLPASAAAGPEELMKAKARVEGMKKERAALLEKHSVDLGDEKQVAGSQGAPAAMSADLNKKLGHVDHAAFIAESRAFLEKYSPGETKQPPALANLKKDYGAVTVDADVATVQLKGERGNLTLVKRDGRWYADLSTMP